VTLRLKDSEAEAIRNGALEIRRQVRLRRRKTPGTPQPRACSIRRGDVADAGEEVYVRVVAVQRDGNDWVIRLERTGSWAVRSTRSEDGPITAAHRQQVLAGAGALELPHPLEVAKGDRFEIVDGLWIEIGRADPIVGRADVRRVRIKLIDLRPSGLLRAAPPSIARRGEVKDPSATEIEWAHIDGAYTRSPAQALGAPRDPEDAYANDPGEGPPQNWKDKRVAQAKARHIEAQPEAEQMRKQESDIRAALGRTLKGVSPEQRIALLAYIAKGCEQAERGELDRAA
jgi:hypothetical protein